MDTDHLEGAKLFPLSQRFWVWHAALVHCAGTSRLARGRAPAWPALEARQRAAREELLALAWRSTMWAMIVRVVLVFDARCTHFQLKDRKAALGSIMPHIATACSAPPLSGVLNKRVDVHVP